MIRADDGAGSLGRVKNLAAVAEKPRLVNTSHARGAHSLAEALRNPVGNRNPANYFIGSNWILQDESRRLKNEYSIVIILF